MNRLHIFFCLLIAPQIYTCMWTASQKGSESSIFKEDSSLIVLAETFPEYEWNENAQRAYSVYLKGLNDYYFKMEYETAIVLFYEAIDIYSHDARFYVRLAESQARHGFIDEALATLNQAGTLLTGFLEQNGIDSYARELNRASEMPVSVVEKPPPKGMIGKIKAAVTWIPRKLYKFVKKFF